MEYKELVSNEYYSLSELFATPNRKIIIPDFQRDYCWGDQTHGAPPYTDIITGFLDTLLEEFKNDKESDLLLGKIDVYELPKNHIYLTDGQQRLTTLYLLIGMLYKFGKEETLKLKLKACLISALEEIDDDKEPYLQYAVRESTVFFLRDLVNDFFIQKNSLAVSEIHKQPWYFNEYKLDPSIISILSALSIIERKLKYIEECEFSKFVIEKIKIQYYDVKDKQHGEERFVIINTTGKGLTVTENIKPILLGSIEGSKFAQEWEERETFFWQNRVKEKENIADNGVNDFLNWCIQTFDKQDEFDIIKKAKEILKLKINEAYLVRIDSYFAALKQVIKYLEIDKYQAQFKFINENKEVKGIFGLRELSKIKQQNVLIPLLSFIAKFENDGDGCYEFLRRLRKNYFHQKWDYRNVHYVDWRYVLQIIENANSLEDILHYRTNSANLKPIQNVKLNEWFNEEEQLKLLFVEQKEVLQRWEDYTDFMGDLTQLFHVADNKHDIIELENYFNTYRSINFEVFTFSHKTKFKNIYRLLLYLKYGRFEHRSVAGKGYCMLVKSVDKLFLLDGFISTWHFFKNNSEEAVYLYLLTILKKFINETVIKGRELETIINDTRKIGHYERVQLWSVLEFLDSEEELNFNKNICQFWDHPNLINVAANVEDGTNEYAIGNMLLGTSYYNNKTGRIDFSTYPLMKKLSNKRDDSDLEEIRKRTIEVRGVLNTFLD
ncbi:DUF262 domain-containing protein [Pedobacter immunditicola]|uniref:DUF262 domain-containing protein n=1 Tax=Pedobacter immunditicola TaxID=3133440 RepID=UPI00309C2308